jgi:putative transposase
MTSKSVAFLTADLGVTKTHSRPYVSDDNRIRKRQFRTMKYRPEFPDRFGCMQDSCCTFCQQFFRSSTGTMKSIATPDRLTHACDGFVRRPPKPLPLPKAVWINRPIPNETTKAEGQ